jgi:Gamma-glutamyltranspeptidase
MQKGVNTTHFSIVDRHGNVVSYTTTIESGWGTGLMVPGYGLQLNNELTELLVAKTSHLRGDHGNGFIDLSSSGHPPHTEPHRPHGPLQWHGHGLQHM